MPSTRWPLSPEPSVPMCPVRTFCCHRTDKAANLTIRQDSGPDLPKGQGLRLKHPIVTDFPAAPPRGDTAADAVSICDSRLHSGFFLEIPITLQVATQAAGQVFLVRETRDILIRIADTL